MVYIMNYTNEEVVQRLKEAILDCYMSYIKQGFKFLLANGLESEISNQIMQFLDAQIDTGNSTIIKDDIIRILENVLTNEFSNFNKERLNYCFPSVLDVKIEENKAAFVTQKASTPFNGFEEKTYYLYIAPDFYNDKIRKN